MSFDIAALDSSTPSEEGREMELLRMDGAVVKHPDGRPVTITLRGRLSRAVQAADREIQNRRLEMSRRGRRVSLEEADDEITTTLVAATKAWSFDTMDGQSFACTPENARKFWTDPRFLHLREQGLVFMREDARFTQR
ncbi:hypothetical protein [Falsiroseomonas sp. CW058]|uniref:hypothetical protein n=1 Tax=Falsiroseomonas sp. CW058 TaxID=3388664 RepID=UPI003D31E439